MVQRSEQISRRLKLRQLNVLVAVAQWGSMAKAAEHLAISQPVVSKAIAELEQIVGVRLFDRVPHGVEPTPHGRALLKRSAAIFDDLRTSVSELESLSDPTAGELRMGFEENLSTGLLPTLIDQVTRQYPRLLFDIALGDPPTRTGLETCLGRLCDADYRSWPATEVAAIDAFFASLLRALLHLPIRIDPTGLPATWVGPVEDVLCMAAHAGFDLGALLMIWEAERSRAAVLHLASIVSQADWLK